MIPTYQKRSCLGCNVACCNCMSGREPSQALRFQTPRLSTDGPLCVPGDSREHVSQALAPIGRFPCGFPPEGSGDTTATGQVSDSRTSATSRDLPHTVFPDANLPTLHEKCAHFTDEEAEARGSLQICSRSESRAGGRARGGLGSRTHSARRPLLGAALPFSTVPQLQTLLQIPLSVGPHPPSLSQPERPSKIPSWGFGLLLLHTTDRGPYKQQRLRSRGPGSWPSEKRGPARSREGPLSG